MKTPFKHFAVTSSPSGNASGNSPDPALYDPQALLQELILCPSVTPEDAGAQTVLKARLEALGFHITDFTFGQTANFYAVKAFGPTPDKGRHLGFAGHTDVVPADDPAWIFPPFLPTVQDGKLYGRGAADMKGGIACFVAAVARFLHSLPSQNLSPSGKISFLITGDEEGKGTDGTRKVLPLLQEKNLLPDFYLVGEPTNPETIGDMIKIGRRGSLNVEVSVTGQSGHIAYLAPKANPVHILLRFLHLLMTLPLDQGTEFFEPSVLQISSVDVGNKTTNVIPPTATAALNIRFNDLHTGASLMTCLEEKAAEISPLIKLKATISGEAFRTEARKEIEFLTRSIVEVTGRMPKIDTGGGTSDARFISKYCPVAEFGPVNKTIHQANEYVSLDELSGLTGIYQTFIGKFFDE